MSLEYLLTWMMVFLRTLGVILQLPVLAGRPLPVMVRLGICVCLATLVAGIVPSASVPPTLWQLIIVTAGEVLLGLTMGFVGRLAFAAVEMAGRMMASEVGLTATPGIGVPEPSTEPLAGLLSAFAVILFFMFGGHQMLLSALTRSFQLTVAGQPAFNPAAGESLIRATGHVLSLGLRMAAPFIAMNFLVTLAFSVLGRTVPKMSVFALSFSVRILAGIGLLGTAGALLARYLYSEFAEAPVRLLQILPVR